MQPEMLKPEMQTKREESIGDQLASWLSARREAITAEWVAAVERDAKLPSSDNLTLQQLRNHLPQLFENLSDTLRDAFNKDLEAKATQTAAKHGEHRWKEGYDLSELIREFAHVRSAFIFELILFDDQHPDFGAAARLFVHVTFHRFFDDAIRNSVQQFREEQQAGSKK